ncbi:uncharacterized protein PRCAT00002851001 [Priceomyces carsonii]|uniref:uncharacterized protein n=1 Tax=Priceomyces carsonii TaxID=28549 RepID=UPI002ED779BA|nr:unnamed protein product [Priceomyces carsonii]
MSGNKFEDIEMLEIPDDSTNNSSGTEGISESLSNDEMRLGSMKQPVKANKVDLRKWLDTGEIPPFEFDEVIYKESLNENQWSQIYCKYVNGLYKVIEELLEDYRQLDIENEPIGLITSSNDIGINASKEVKNQKLSDSFTRIIEALDRLIKELSQCPNGNNEEDSIANSNSDNKDEDLENFQFLMNILECIQANCFYSDINVRPELISKWINKYDAKPDNELVESVAINSPKPYLHHQFWNTYISQLILRGMVTQAGEAIAHSNYEELKESEPKLYTVISDFKTLLSNYSTMSLKGQFPQWKLACCEFRDIYSKMVEGITLPQLSIIKGQIYDLICILTGLPKTISNLCDNWYEIYSALALYQVRDDKNLYKEFYKVAISELPPAISSDGDDLFDIVEHSYVDVMEGNFLKVLEAIFKLDPATSSYVSKLFEMKGYLDSYYSISDLDSLESFINKKTISDYFLMIHAYNCLNLHSLIPVGIGLLLNPEIATSKQLSVNNRKVVAEVLPKYVYRTNDDLEWGLTICAKLNLVSTAKELYYLHGLKSLEEGLLLESLNMFVNCYDPTLINGASNIDGMKKVHYIAWDLIFQDSLLNNRPVADELINGIVEHKVSDKLDIHPVIKQCLAPYAVLFEFYRSLGQDNQSNSAIKRLSRLIHLIRFNHLPRKFCPLLLSQILPFLISSYYKFTLPDVIVIIELINSYESQVKDEELEEGESLYKYAIANIESETKPYDWRVILKSSGTSIPKSVHELLKRLRNEIVVKIGKVYIDK